MSRRRWLLLAALSLLAFVAALCVGGAGWLGADLWTGTSGVSTTILLRLRAPRVMVAWLVGAALAVSGAALQGLFRNPLADPGVLGVSAAASLAAQLTTLFAPAQLLWFLLPLSAALGALVATSLLVSLLRVVHVAASELLVLSGVAVGQLAVAGSTLLLSLAVRDFTLAERLLSWMLGDLDGRTWLHVAWAVGPVLVGVVGLARLGPELDALLLGETTARSLGVDVVKLRRAVVIGAATLSGVAVAVGGVVAFVGLIVPHAMRRLGAGRHTPLLFASAFGGGLLVTVSDAVSRVVIAPAEIQIGVVTAVLGAPAFVWILTGRLRDVAA